MKLHNTLNRRLLLILAIILCSIPSSLGIYAALVPTRGVYGAASASGGIELIYLSIGLLVLNTKELQQHARRVQLSAVFAAVFFNTLADYNKRVPGGLKNTQMFTSTFDVLSAVLSFLESLPLAGLAYAASILVHKLSTDVSFVEQADTVSWLSKMHATMASTYQKFIGIFTKPSALSLLPISEMIQQMIDQRLAAPGAILATLFDRYVYQRLRASVKEQLDQGYTKTQILMTLFQATSGDRYRVASDLYEWVTKSP